jgi:hypothetical protein
VDLLIIGQLDFYQKMFIKVERDIVDVILNQQRDKKRERAIDVIVQLMTASRLNHHKVYLKCQLDGGQDKELQAALDENSWREFYRLQKERIDFYGLVEMLDVYAVITISKHSSRVGKELQINPFEASGFFLDAPTYLCTENQRDGKFYQIVCSYYLTQERILNMSTSYKKWKGGGSDYFDIVRGKASLVSGCGKKLLDSLLDDDGWKNKSTLVISSFFYVILISFSCRIKQNDICLVFIQVILFYLNANRIQYCFAMSLIMTRKKRGRPIALYMAFVIHLL